MLLADDIGEAAVRGCSNAALLDTVGTVSVPPAVVRRLRWRTLPLLWLGYCCCFIDRSNVAFAALQMRKSLGLTDAVFGLASGLFFVSYALMQVPCNHLVGRLGSRRILAATLFVWSALSVACGFTQGPVSLCVLRFLLGLAEAGYAPGVTLYQSRIFPAATLGRSIAIVGTAGGGGYAVGALTAGSIMERLDGVGGMEGWRWLFVVQGAPGMLVGVLFLRFLSDECARSRTAALARSRTAALVVCLHCPTMPSRSPSQNTTHANHLGTRSVFHRPHDASWLQPDERRLLRAERESSQAGIQVGHPPASTARSLGASVAATASRPLVCLLCVEHFVTNVLSYAGSFFMPEIVRQAYPALSLAQVSMICTIPAILIVAASPNYAACVDATLRRRFAGAWAAIGLAAMLMLTVGGCMLASSLASPGGEEGVGGAARREMPPAQRARPAPLSPVITRALGSPLLLLSLLGASYVAALCSQGPFWSLVSSYLQPLALEPVGIAWVNSVGNLGGFLGPYALGYMHDALGPTCEPPGGGAPVPSAPDAAALPSRAPVHGCTSQFGWGVVILGLGGCLLTAGTAAAFLPTLRADERRSAVRQRCDRDS